MNKLLLASTALVASTTFAMADVELTGFAEMGIFGGERPSGDDIDTQFHTDIDATFSMSGETDTGLTFGATIDLDSLNDEDADGNIGAFDASEGGDDTSVFVSGSLGTLTMGDTDGAYDFALQEAIIGGTLQDDNEHAGYDNGIVGGNSGLDGLYSKDAGDEGQIARYDYSFGDFSVALSAEIDDNTDRALAGTELGDIGFDIDEISAFVNDEIRAISNDTVLGIGFRYSGEFSGVSFGAGLGYQQAGNFEVTDITVDDNGTADTDDDVITDVEYEDNSASVVGGSLDFAMDNGLQAILNYSSYDEFPGGIEDHVGVAVGYEFDAWLVAVNWGKFTYEDINDSEGVALTVNYDLGGGAELQGGYAHNEVDNLDPDVDGTNEYDRYSFGIAMSF